MQKSSFVLLIRGGPVSVLVGVFLNISQFTATLCGLCTIVDGIHPSAKGFALLLVRSNLASRS